MTAHDPRVTLTEVLAGHVRLPMMHSQGCTCGWHASLSHPNLHRAHLAQRLEEHIAARLAPIRALADEWERTTTGRSRPAFLVAADELRAALDAPVSVVLTCRCPPCPGRGNDGHGMTHCAECCFGTRVDAELDCPTHGDPRYPTAEEQA